MNASSLSRKILIGIMVLFLLSLFQIADLFSPFVVLLPSKVFPGFELWRLLTYPLARDFMGLLIASICFGAPAEEVEGMIGTRQFGILLLMVTVSAGLMHLVLFLGEEQYALGGPISTALFVLVGFVYLFPQSEVRLLFFSVRSWIVLAFSSAIVLFMTIFAITSGASPWLLFSYGGFGLLLGAIYFHVRYQKYAVLLRPIRSLERMVTGSRQTAPVRPSSSQRRVQVSPATRIRIPFQKAAPRDISDEERLNMILDRINESSYSALTEEEQRFLREYSSRI
jgi:hypothetical protein